MATTSYLATLSSGNDQEAYEAALKRSGLVRVTARQSEKIEAVSTWAMETGHSDIETICRLAQDGHGRSVRLILAKEARLVRSGYRW